MRFLVAGLVLIVLGIGLTEYTRRHPSEEKKSGAKGAKKVKNAPSAPPTMQALVETAAPAPDAAAPKDSFDLQALVTSTGDATAGFTPVLRGTVKARELRATSDGVVLVLEKGGSTALVAVPAGGSPSVLTVRSGNVSAVTFDPKDKLVVWGEGGLVKAVPVGGGEVKTLASFVRALVTSVGAYGSKVVVSLVPKDGDPFSADPNGAVALVDGDDVKLIALEQIRPREVVFDGKDDAFFVAGYPSGLTRAALDGSFTARIAERADGPIALESDGITWRSPQASSPELKRGARSGGAVKTVARVDVEWLAVQGGVARYTTAGIAPRLYEAKVGEDSAAELAAIKGVAKGLAWVGEKTWLLSADEDGVSTLQVK
jgi:hypothetical protein